MCSLRDELNNDYNLTYQIFPCVFLISYMSFVIADDI